jgi:inner membrane protein
MGELIAGKQLGRKAMLYGALANNIPDIDVISSLWADESSALLIHRGITHSILACAILTPLLAFLSKKSHKSSDLSFSRWALLWGSGLFLHILLDAFTTYGTGWFEPFDHSRVSFNAIFILDPIFMLPVLIASIVLLVKKRYAAGRIKWAAIGLSLSALYLLMVIINKTTVNNVVKNNLASQKINYRDYMSTPTPLNNFLWYILVRDTGHFLVGYYSVFDRDSNIAFENFQQNDSLLSYNCNPAHVARLKRFSQQYYSARLENDTVIFSDMRFGQVGGWYQKQSPFVFNFRLAQKCTNKIALQKGRLKTFGPDALSQLFKRIKGN